MPEAPPQAPVKGALWPYLMVEGALKAADFYEKALGAEHASGMPPGPDGRTMNVHIYVNGNSVMLTDPMPDHGFPFEGHKGNTLHLAVDDVDAWHRRAVEAGATSRQDPHRPFWGGRYAMVRDPFGVDWAFSTPGE